MRFTFSIPRATPNDMQSKTRKRPKVAGKFSEYGRRIFFTDNFSCDRVGKKFQDPADDDAVTDCDSERSDNGDQPDECAKF